MKNVASFAFLALLFCAASASWDSLDSIQHHSSDLDIVNEDIIPRLLQEVLGDADVPGAYGDSAPTDATEETPALPVAAATTPAATATTSPDTPVTETPVTETDVTETDVTETPVTETDVTETPITETPVTETDITETDVTETPVTETPVTETPVTETAITETDVTETDVTETPLTETPVTETATTETPVTETSITPVVQPTQPTVVETPTPAVDSAADTTPAVETTSDVETTPAVDTTPDVDTTTTTPAVETMTTTTTTDDAAAAAAAPATVAVIPAEAADCAAGTKRVDYASGTMFCVLAAEGDAEGELHISNGEGRAIPSSNKCFTAPCAGSSSSSSGGGRKMLRWLKATDSAQAQQGAQFLPFLLAVARAIQPVQMSADSLAHSKCFYVCESEIAGSGN